MRSAITSVAEMLQFIVIGILQILCMPFEFTVKLICVTAGLVINGCFKLARWFGVSLPLEYASGQIR